jgi:UDP:flavonoid glycosyltransferase YjiC (YdhE family)
VSRLLLFPWGAGGAAGYTCRCLELARRVGDRHRCAFGPEALIGLVEEAGYPLVGSRERWAPRAQRHGFLPFANVERVYAVAARYCRAEVLRAHVARDRAAIESHRPDAVVIDMQPAAAIAARSLGLPVVSLADADFLSPSPLAWMPWLTLAPDALLPYPPCVPAFNEVLAELGLDPIAWPTELLWGDVTLVPSCAELEPVEPPPPGRAPAHHVGPLYWDPPAEVPPLPNADGAARVYVTIGSGGMITGPILERVAAALARPGLSVFVSAGIAPPPGLAERPGLRIGGFTGLTETLRWSDVVVTHGGYSSVVAAHLQARPQVVLPLMSEHEANGREMVERPGCGLLVRRTRTDDGGRHLRFVNRVSGESDDPVPAEADILDAVNQVLGDDSYRERATAMSERLLEARRTADLGALLELARV